MRLMNGNALVARLAKSAFDKDVPIWTSSGVKRLLRGEDGQVTGAVVERPDGPVEVHARKGEAVGADNNTDLPHSAAWVPISRPPMGNGLRGTFPHFVDRSKPGVIAITRSGRRFVNEAQSYHDFCQAMVKRCRDEGGRIRRACLRPSEGADETLHPNHWHRTGAREDWHGQYRLQSRTVRLASGARCARITENWPQTSRKHRK